MTSPSGKWVFETEMAVKEFREFQIHTDDSELEDLRRRLAATRWPEKETVSDWSQGIPLEYLQDLCAYWAKDYDWHSRAEKMNRFPQFLSRINGLDIHFIHQRSPVEDAPAVIMTHGWPGSVVEFLKVIGPLTDPEAHGGRREDAMHLVCPSLPGYGWSGKPAEPGWGVQKIAETWNQLMLKLGYTDYLAQGGDWGGAVTTAIGMAALGNCRAIHLNFPLGVPTEAAKKSPTEADLKSFAAIKRYQKWETGYSTQQKTRPQSIGYGLVDSPAGLAAWVVEKFQAWTDCNGHPENILSRDELLDNLMLYWLPATGASAARLYWESFDTAFNPTVRVDLPTACSIFHKEIVPMPRSWTEARYPNMMYWNEIDSGGHFAAFEQPELFVREMRAWLQALRSP